MSARACLASSQCNWVCGTGVFYSWYQPSSIQACNFLINLKFICSLLTTALLVLIIRDSISPMIFVFRDAGVENLLISGWGSHISRLVRTICIFEQGRLGTWVHANMCKHLWWVLAIVCLLLDISDCFYTALWRYAEWILSKWLLLLRT